MDCYAGVARAVLPAGSLGREINPPYRDTLPVNTRDLIAAAMQRAIVADGNTPVRAEYDAAGKCKTCGETVRACPGWHAAERVQQDAADDV